MWYFYGVFFYSLVCDRFLWLILKLCRIWVLKICKCIQNFFKRNMFIKKKVGKYLEGFYLLFFLFFKLNCNRVTWLLGELQGFYFLVLEIQVNCIFVIFFRKVKKRLNSSLDLMIILDYNYDYFQFLEFNLLILCFFFIKIK